MKTRLDVELKDVRGQLVDSVKENKRLRRGIFNKCLDEPLNSSVKKHANRIISVGMLTGRPKEEMPEKISACRQGAREAWAMVKTRYAKANPNH